MIIGPSSPLRLLPAGLDRSQMLFFDGIRVGIEMAELAYGRLKAQLHQIAILGPRSEEWDKLVSICFVDAWSIVDAFFRLRSLLHRFPGLRQRTPFLQVFLRQLEPVKELRHAIQHVDERIDELARCNQSVWGTL